MNGALPLLSIQCSVTRDLPSLILHMYSMYPRSVGLIGSNSGMSPQEKRPHFYPSAIPIHTLLAPLGTQKHVCKEFTYLLKIQKHAL